MKELNALPRGAHLVLIALVLFAGCLPSSGRQNSRAMSAADSASVALAETTPVDTLALAWEAAARPDDLMPLPTGIAWAGTGDRARLVVVETQEGSIRLWTPSGRQAKRLDVGGGEESYPYLAGVRGDTVAVLERGQSRIAFVPLDSSGAIRRIPVPQGAGAALVTDSAVFVRTGGGTTEEAPELLRLGESGRTQARFAFRGQPWRAFGFLRAWGDDVLALSGYRPVVDVWRPGQRARLDTLALTGFSSPELPRSAQFMRGDVDEPPLLTSSASALGERLFVLNMRDDHVRIDVYRSDGELQRVLVSPGPPQTLAYIPVDIAVREIGTTVEIAVLLQRPSGVIQRADSRVVLYRWSAEA